jgi:pyruvate/2-oxoglutarate dehydrogenase complex dihydrolipoamide acyltransferase (E2) component
MDVVGKYQTQTFLSSRLLTMDVCHIGLRKHYVEALVELDITEARKKIREKKRLSEDVSLTAWLIKCISNVCVEYKLMHGIRSGKRKVVVFDDVDISIMVERDTQGETVPLPYVLRRTNEKSVSEIWHEIKDAQEQPIRGEEDYVLGSRRNAVLMRMFCSLPGFLRRYFLNRMIRNPILAKRGMGTVMVSSLNMLGRFKGWFVPVGIHTLIVAVGSMSRKPGIVDGEIEIREFLDLSILVDHDVVDGGPAARALSRLTQLIESGSGL